MLLNGIVLDESGAPMAGVTVVDSKNPSSGTTTGAKGTYNIIVSRQCDSLRFSFVGYKPQTVGVRDAALIRMQPDAQDIGEVVVTGIFTRKAESYTGAAVTIGQDDLKRVGNQNMFQSLKSLDPSLNIFTNMTMGSDPNSLPDMQMRGTSTFPSNETASSLRGNYMSNPNAPLFIVDGFETTLERVFDMDMNRIANVTLLKDASAKALYGSKAANGVVVIETKRFNSDETRVTYTGSVSLEMPDLTSYDLCNALEKLQVEKAEGFYERGDNPNEIIALKQIYNQRLAWAQAGNSTYWLSKPLKTGVSHKHTVSVEMGADALRSIADFSYTKTQGVMKGSDRQNISGDINLMYRYKKILFRNIMSVSSVKSNDSPYGNFSQYAMLNPYWKPYDESGNLVRYFEGASGNKSDRIGNPLYDATLSTKLTESYLYFNNNFYIEAELVKGLKAIASIGVSAKRLDGEDFYPADHSNFISMTNAEDLMRKGSYTMVQGKSSSLDGKFDFQYSNTFGRHMIFADLSYQISESKFSEYTFMAEGFPSDKMTNISYARQYAEGTTPQCSDGITRNIGILGYLAYGFDNRYNVDLTYRLNGASVFGNDNPWANFWSAGIAWNIHNEKFMKGVKDLHTFKLRFSYGLTGNQNFSTNTTFAIYKYNTTAQYNGFIGALLQNMANPDLAWEKKKEYNVGLDLIYKGLNLRADYYNARTSDMVIGLTTAPSVGFSSVKDNLGEVRNTGFEIALTYSILRRKNGFLNINASIATNKNRIIRLSNSMKAFNDQQMEIAEKYDQAAPVLKYVEGMPLRAIWAVPSLGIDPQTGKEVFMGKDGKKTFKWSANDMVNCGTSDNKYNGVLGLNGEYKGFGLSVAATFLGGGKYYNQTLIDRVEDVDIYFNVDRRVLTGRWQIPGQHAQYSSLQDSFTEDGSTYYISTKPTSRFVQKRNELSLTSISLYYDFNPALISKIRMKQLRLAFYINDVATFSSIKIERGTDYPFARSMSFSLTATF